MGPRGLRAGWGARAGRAVLPALAAVGALVPVVVAPAGAAPVSSSGPGAPGSPGSPGSSAAPGAPGAQPVTIELLEQAPWQHRGDAAVLRIKVDNAPGDATIEVERHDAVDSRGAFAESLEDELGTPDETLAPAPLASLAPAPEGGSLLTYPMAEDEGLDNFGVYPLRVLVADGGGSTLAELVTYLVVLPDEGNGFPPLSVAILMEVGGPNSLQPDGSVLVAAETHANVDSRVEVLRRSRLPITVAPRPETLDALAVPPDPDDPATPQLDELLTSLGGRVPLARPYVDLDLDSLAAADLVTQVPAEAERGAQVIRTRFGVEPVGGTWLAGPTLGEAGLDALRDLRTPYVVLPESAVASVDDVEAGEVPTGPVSLGEGAPLGFVADDTLAERLTATGGPVDAQRFLAELAIVWMTRPSVPRGVLVRIPESATIDVDTVSTALDGLAVGGAVRVVDTTSLFQDLGPGGSDPGDDGSDGSGDDGDDTPPTAELAASGDHDDLRPLVEPLGEAQARIPALAATLNDTEQVELLQRSLLVALGADTPQGERRAYVDRVNVAAADLAAKVSAPEEFQITLAARDGTIPLVLTNDTGRDVEVAIHLESSQLTFPDGTTRHELLTPGLKRLDLDVRTRTSGAFPLDITVTSADGTIVLDETTFTVRSTAVSGAGVFLSAGAGLFLLIWWARHWRTARRSSRLVGHDAP